MDTVGHFSLWGDFELEDVTNALHLEPSCVYRKGDVLDGADFPSRFSTWDLYCPANSSMNEQIDFLLAALSPRADALRPLALQYRAEINLGGNHSEGTQIINLKVETMQSLAGLHIGLNCFYGKDKAEDAN